MRNRWILTGTFDAQAPKPSLTVTSPTAIRCLRRSKLIVRSWVVAVPVTVKLVALVPVPVGVVTEIGPVVAPAGTVALMCVLLVTVNVVAETPLNFTAVAPVKLVPVIVTDVPTGPLAGVNEVIVGAPVTVTVKLVALVAVPPAVVMEMGPVVAPVGTVAVMCVALVTVKVVAEIPLNFTDVAPVNPVPVITTDAPIGPLVGVNDVIVGTGAAVTVKLVALVAVPSAFVTEIVPVVAPAGTVAVTLCGLLIVNVADVPLNFNEVTSGSGPVKLSPLISTVVPTGPLVGVKEEIVGAAAKAASAPGMATVSPVTRTTNEIRALRRRILIMPSLAIRTMRET